MCRKLKMTVCLGFILFLIIPSVFGHDVPRRKAEIKIYAIVLFPHDFWKIGARQSFVNDKAAFGAGFKFKTQISGGFGCLVNFAHTKLSVNTDATRHSYIFTSGPYYSIPALSGNLSFDLNLGVVSASYDGVELIAPAVEYALPVSDRLNVALEVGWPIPNDLLLFYDFEENYSSFYVTLGTSYWF
jgi:hypothetical protein